MVLDLESPTAVVGRDSAVPMLPPSGLVVDTVSGHIVCGHQLEHLLATIPCRLLGFLTAWSMCVSQDNQKETDDTLPYYSHKCIQIQGERTKIPISCRKECQRIQGLCYKISHCLHTGNKLFTFLLYIKKIWNTGNIILYDGKSIHVIDYPSF